MFDHLERMAKISDILTNHISPAGQEAKGSKPNLSHPLFLTPGSENLPPYLGRLSLSGTSQPLTALVGFPMDPVLTAFNQSNIVF
jgi:hypothetical protein